MVFLPFSTKNYFFKSKKRSKAKLLNGIRQTHKVCTFLLCQHRHSHQLHITGPLWQEKMASVNVEVYDAEIWEYSFWTIIQFLICVMEPVTVKHWTNHLSHCLASGRCL